MPWRNSFAADVALENRILVCSAIVCVLNVCSNSVFPLSTMYWADWGNHPKIETAAMDGTLRQTLVHENIQWPTGQHCMLFISTMISPGKLKHASLTATSCFMFPARHSLLFYMFSWLYLLPFCLYRSGCGLLQRASLLGRCQTLSDWQRSSGWFGPCHFCLRHQKQLSSFDTQNYETWNKSGICILPVYISALNLLLPPHFQTCSIHSA